nr:winged helix-turn-helix domain-containing protein [Brevibacillus laterosporus]
MEWQPNRKSRIPIYKQISQYLEQRITNGEYPSGTILPSERLLSKELDVNRSTIVAAYMKNCVPPVLWKAYGEKGRL